MFDTASALKALLQEHRIAAHALVGPRDDVQRAAKQLRTSAAPGSRVLMAQRPERSAWGRLTALLGARESHMTVSEELACSLLCAGFETPTLLADTPELVAVWAQLPLRADPLDEIFA